MPNVTMVRPSARVAIVVLVEDTPMIAKLIAQMVEPFDVELRHACSDVTLLMDEGVWRDVDIALVDLLLPGTVGDELLEWLATRAPHVRRVAMSGAGQQRLDAATAADVRLSKPFVTSDLVEALGPSR